MLGSGSRAQAGQSVNASFVSDTYSVKIQTFAELVTPDERSLRFTSLGLSPMGILAVPQLWRALLRALHDHR